MLIARTMLPPESGRKYVAAVDASEGGDDGFALAIAFADGEQIVQVYGQAWEKPKTRTIDLSATVQGIAATLTRYGVKRVYGDLVQRKVDLLVSAAGPAAEAVKQS